MYFEYSEKKGKRFLKSPECLAKLKQTEKRLDHLLAGMARSKMELNPQQKRSKTMGIRKRSLTDREEIALLKKRIGMIEEKIQLYETRLDFEDIVKYKIGDKFTFTISGKTYILAQVGDSDAALVNIVDGNRWNDPVHVDIQYGYISGKDFAKVCGGEKYRFQKE